MRISTGLRPEATLYRVPLHQRFFDTGVEKLPVTQLTSEEVWVTRFYTTQDTPEHPAGTCIHVLHTPDEPYIEHKGARAVTVRDMDTEQKEHYRRQLTYQHDIPADATEKVELMGLQRDIEETTIEWYVVEV